MDDRNESNLIGSTQFLILLQSIPHVGEKAIIRLLNSAAQLRLTPEALLNFTADELETRLELDPRSAHFLLTNKDSLLARSEQTAKLLRSRPLQLLSIIGAAYPIRMERYCDIPPPIVYALGNLSLLDPCNMGTEPKKFTFSIASSRSTGSASLNRLDEIAEQLAILGGIPVTGHDRPEYQRLALSAQRRNLPVLYVFDRGLREALGPNFDRPPFAAARIRDETFLLERDLAISPFQLDHHCIGGNNRRRDNLVFALSDVVIAHDVREAGALYPECVRAYEQKKRVYVNEGGRDGNDALRKIGVPIFRDASEIVRQLS